jgi:signal transduction histidine kinase
VPHDVPVEAAPRQMTREPMASEPMTTEQPSYDAAADDAWRSDSGRWQAYFALVLAAAVVYVLAEHAPWERTAIAVGLLLALVPWFVFVGRRVIGHDDIRPSSLAFVAGLVALSGGASVAAPSASIVLFALCPLCFMVLTWGRGLIAVLALNLVPSARFFLQTPDLSAILAYAVWATVIITFSGMFALWINRIIGQSTERRELIQQLRATRAELAEVSREAGALAERERMAWEIHDTLAQGFTSILMLLQAAEPHIVTRPDEARRQVGLALQTARENLEEARALVAAQPPAPLGAASLDETVRRLTERLGDELDIPADYTVAGEPRRLAAGVEVVLLRAVQEGLANIRKHANAGRVAVALAYEDGAVRLAVRDDGIGFDQRAAGGFGLRGMRERVGQVGGTLDIGSTPGTGTTITVEVTET